MVLINQIYYMIDMPNNIKDLQLVILSTQIISWTAMSPKLAHEVWRGFHRWTAIPESGEKQIEKSTSSMNSTEGKKDSY
jgi:hypothetical protein